jgi:hypothetical protein
LGRNCLAFLRQNQELAFSHSYLCISSYNIEDDKLTYMLNVEGVEREYHFYLDEPLALRDIDTQLANCIAAANKKDGGRRGSTIKPRSGSWIKVGRGGNSPRGPVTEATPDIVGARYVIKVRRRFPAACYSEISRKTAAGNGQAKVSVHFLHEHQRLRGARRVSRHDAHL